MNKQSGGVMDLRRFIAGLPKAELHIHLEGALEPELMLSLAARNGVKLPYASVEALRTACDFKDLQAFLDVYYAGLSALQTEQDFHALTMAYLERAQADAARHVEVFFDPQAHTERGLAFATPMAGISRALAEGRERFGVSTRLILCFMRHLSEADAFATLEQAAPHLDSICAVGLDSSELGHPPAKFAQVFSAAADLGLRRVAHAGEEGPPGYVEEALDALQVERVDHGNRAMEDPALIRRLRDSQTPLTLCPLSNLRLRVVKSLAAHPLKTMLEQGLLATVNSDDPAYFGGYVNDNYQAVAEALDLNRDQLVRLAKNSFTASFLSPDEKARHIRAIDQYAASH